MFNKLKELFSSKQKKEAKKDAEERQKLFDANKNAVNKLKELRDLFNYLVDSSGPTNRKVRKEMRQRIISEEKFGPELIKQAIEFFEKRVTALNELEKRHK